jgi:hypothetical protein
MARRPRKGKMPWHAPPFFGGGKPPTFFVPQETSGNTTPEWVPDNAKIHIDFLGGSPQGRAYVDGTGEIGIETLLGEDPNTMSGWSVSAYDPEGITPDGYLPSAAPYTVAFLATARSMVLAGATVVVSYKQILANPEESLVPVTAKSTNGTDGIYFNMRVYADPPTARVASYTTAELNLTLATQANVGVDAFNKGAVTLTATRGEYALNGGPATATTLSAAVRPAGNPFTAAAIDLNAHTALQSVTIYDPLPSTAGLSELSAF